MGTVLDDMGTLLTAAGCGTIAAPMPTIFTGVVPSTPSACISLLEYRPPNHDEVQVFGPTGTKPAVELSNVQVQTRHEVRDQAVRNAFAAYRALNRYSGTVDGTEYLLVLAGGPPFPLNRDENNRWIFAFNLRVMRRPS